MSLGVNELLRNGAPSLGERLKGVRGAINGAGRAWRGLTLSSRFSIAAAVVILLGMTALGAWVNDRIKNGVVHNSAANAALYLVGFIEPHVAELRTSNQLSPAAQERVDAVFRRLVQQRKIIGIKVWAKGGTLAYSSDKRRIGQIFPETDKLQKAWAGEIKHEYDDLSEAENDLERTFDVPTLEVYTPLRDPVTNEIVAVGEVYEIAQSLAAELRSATIQTAFVVGSVALLLIGTLFQIVQRGSRTIELQQKALSERISELSNLLRVNRQLHQRVADANRRAVDTNEQFLRRIGADLHDGPAQLIGLGLLRLDALRPRIAPIAARTTSSGTPLPDDLDIIEGALRDSLRELRAICADIAVPDLQGANLTEVLKRVVYNHEQRTATPVVLDISGELPSSLTLPVMTCLYRFAQEGLNNAFRHAGGKGQRVAASFDGRVLELVVSDEGDGLAAADAGNRFAASGGLGLLGLRDRILSIGGEFEAGNAVPKGTRLVARFITEQNSRDNGTENG